MQRSRHVLDMDALSSRKKKDQQSNSNSSANTNSSAKCTYCGHDGHFAIKCFLKLHGKSFKGKPVNLTDSKKRQFNDMNATEAEEFK